MRRNVKTVKGFRLQRLKCIRNRSEIAHFPPCNETTVLDFYLLCCKNGLLPSFAKRKTKLRQTSPLRKILHFFSRQWFRTANWNRPHVLSQSTVPLLLLPHCMAGETSFSLFQDVACACVRAWMESPKQRVCIHLCGKNGCWPD